MGITSSNSSRNPPEKVEKLGDPSVDWPEPAKEALRGCMRELDAMFGSKEGDTERREKEGDTERREKEADVRFCEFMKGGACKQAFTALEDCVEETGLVTKCRERSSLLFKCMYSHHDYYQPILAVVETAQNHILKEIQAEIQALLATRQAQGFKTI